MFAGFLRYVHRVRPGWIHQELRGRSLGVPCPPEVEDGAVEIGEEMVAAWAAVMHGQAKLASVDRDEWVFWRDQAVSLTMTFRAEFDPDERLPTRLAPGTKFEEVGARLYTDNDWDPMALANGGAGLGAYEHETTS